MGANSTEITAIAAAIGGLASLVRTDQPRELAADQGIGPVLLALVEFDACVRYLNTRRSAGAVINIETEADVQDVLYLLLRPWITDISYESPGDKTANRFVIKDFSSGRHRFVLDAKFIRDKDHGRLISKELHDDIEMYRSHPRCDHLIFFVYDPNGFIPDQRALRESIEIERSYSDKSGTKKLICHLIVKP
jgi:DpnII restriction endonuclease